jgi:adenosylcobyric acid synthase
MLGQQVLDPRHLEGEEAEYRGLNVLPLTTTITAEKITRTRLVSSTFPQKGLPVKGYEIHQGVSKIINSTKEQFLPLFDDASLGLVNESQSIWGCYLHGVFDNGPWRRTWLNHLRHRREIMINDLADLVEQYVNLSSILPI